MQEEAERLILEAAGQERDQTKQAAEELRKKEHEEQDRAILEQTQSHDDDLLESSVPSSSTAIEYPSLVLEFGLIPFIPSQEHVVADFNTIFYDKNKKIIVMRTKKRVETMKKQGIMVTEKIVIHGTDKDPKLLSREGVASALANVDIVDKIMDDLEQYKKKVSQMKETLNKEIKR